MLETERAAFLIEQDRKIGHTRKEIAGAPSDADQRGKITKKIEELKTERALRIKEWMENVANGTFS